MRATLNSGSSEFSRRTATRERIPADRRRRFGAGCLAGALGLALAILLMPPKLALGAGKSVFAQRAEQAYLKARASHRADPANDELAWQFARASFYWADHATENGPRAALAEEAIAVCRQLIKRQPKSAPGHYYLALNLGQLARTRTLSALGIVAEMETELKTAIALDAALSHAGPDRTLGILYRDAPGWPASIGNRTKAREHLQRAAKLSPDYPENRLTLLESYLEWNDTKAFATAFEGMAETMANARKQFTGVDWEEDWADWNPRWEKLRSKAPETSSTQ